MRKEILKFLGNVLGRSEGEVRLRVVKDMCVERTGGLQPLVEKQLV